MTLEEAIERYEKLSKEYEKEAIAWHEIIRSAVMDYIHEDECKKCAEEYRQLAEWLIELKKYREKDRYNNYDVCLGGFHLD